MENKRVNVNVKTNESLLKMVNKHLSEGNKKAYETAVSLGLIKNDTVNWSSNAEASACVEKVLNGEDISKENLENAPDGWLWDMVYDGSKSVSSTPAWPPKNIRNEFEKRLNDSFFHTFICKSSSYSPNFMGAGGFPPSNYVLEKIRPFFVSMEGKEWRSVKVMHNNRDWWCNYMSVIQTERRKIAGKKAAKSRKDNSVKSKTIRKQEKDSLYQAILHNDSDRITRHNLAELPKKRFDLVKDLWLSDKTNPHNITYMLLTPESLHKPYLVDILTKCNLTRYVRTSYAIDRTTLEKLPLDRQLLIVNNFFSSKYGSWIITSYVPGLEEVDNLIMACRFSGIGIKKESYREAPLTHLENRQAERKIALLGSISDITCEGSYATEDCLSFAGDTGKLFMVLHSAGASVVELLDALFTVEDEKMRSDIAKTIATFFISDVEKWLPKDDMTRLIEIEYIKGNA